MYSTIYQVGLWDGLGRDKDVTYLATPRTVLAMSAFTAEMRNVAYESIITLPH